MTIYTLSYKLFLNWLDENTVYKLNNYKFCLIINICY